MHAEGHIHEVAYEKMQYGVAAQGPGTTGKRVVRRGVRARLPGKSTWGRVVHLHFAGICAMCTEGGA